MLMNKNNVMKTTVFSFWLTYSWYITLHSILSREGRIKKMKENL